MFKSACCNCLLYTSIGLNDEYEEYAIHDYEQPFEIDEYTPIEEVNRLCEMVEDLPEYI